MTCGYNKSENDLTALLLFLKQYHELLGASQVALVVKNPPANAGDEM